MAWTKECWKGGLLSSSMLAWKRENTKRSSGRLEQWRDKKSIQIQLVTTYCSNTCLNTKLFAILRNKENWPGSRVSAYFCTSSVVWAGHPSMLSHMNWFPCYRFLDVFGTSLYRFYISRCIFLHDKSLEYIPPHGEFSLLLIWAQHLNTRNSWLNHQNGTYPTYPTTQYCDIDWNLGIHGILAGVLLTTVPAWACWFITFHPQVW